MNLSDIKNYLQNRINTVEILALSDEELMKYLVTSENLLNIVYEIPDKTLDFYIMSVGEEMLFIFNNNIDLNLFYEYNGLTSFDIAGAVKGSVDYKNTGDLIAPMVKIAMEANGILKKVEIDSDHTTSFVTV